MTALLHFGWLICLVVSVFAIDTIFGYAGLSRMFPEGRRWWEMPARLGALAAFAIVVLYHPFGDLL